jgi:hypothetical protein
MTPRNLFDLLLLAVIVLGTALASGMVRLPAVLA